MTLNISGENEKLLDAVVASGRYKTQEEALTEALRLLQRDTTDEEIPESRGILQPEEWLREFDRITQSRTGGNPQMDDSRDAIYGDRGL